MKKQNKNVRVKMILDSRLSAISPAWQRWGLMLWILNLLAMVALPNAIGAGGGPVSDLFQSACLLLFLSPFV